MKPKITIGIKQAETDSDLTAICVMKQNRNGIVEVFDLFRAKPTDRNYKRKLREFTLKGSGQKLHAGNMHSMRWKMPVWKSGQRIARR